MTLEAYVIGSILLGAVVVVAMVHLSPDPYEDVFKCPRCGAMMQDIGSGVGGCVGTYVVQKILVLTCPQCGYSERSWTC